MIENDSFALMRLSEQELGWDWVSFMTSRAGLVETERRFLRVSKNPRT